MPSTGTNSVHSDSGEQKEIDRTGYGKGPRITPEFIESQITSEHYFTAHQGARTSLLDDVVESGAAETLGKTLSLPDPLRLLTFCVLVLKNGFTVHGISACASPSNFSQEIGQKVARQDAINKIWPLLGYMLVEQLHRIKVHGVGDDNQQDELDEAMTRLLAHQLGNPEALRPIDAELLLGKLEEKLPAQE